MILKTWRGVIVIVGEGSMNVIRGEETTIGGGEAIIFFNVG